MRGIGWVSLVVVLSSCGADPDDTAPAVSLAVRATAGHEHAPRDPGVWSLKRPGEQIGDPPVPLPRLQFGMVALSDTRALLIGGNTGWSFDPDMFLDRCAVYDVHGNHWTTFPSLHEPVAGAFVGSLSRGRVVVAGGYTAYPENDWDYDEETHVKGMAFVSRSYVTDAGAASPRWVPTGPMPFPKANYNEPTDSIVRLRDGRLLLQGGQGLDFDLGVWDPTGMLFTPGIGASPGSWDVTRDQTRQPVPVHRGTGKSLTRIRIGDQPEGYQYTAKVTRLVAAGGRFTTQDEGQPIVIEGADHPENDSSAASPFFVYRVLDSTTLLLWNPDSVDEASFHGHWVIGGRRPWTRAETGTFWTANALMGDGKVLRPGGISGYDIQSGTHEPIVDTATIYDPVTQRWSQSPPMPPIPGEDPPWATSGPRAYPIVVALADGRVLVAGGHVEHLSDEGESTGLARHSAVIYDPDHPDDPWSIVDSRMAKAHGYHGQGAQLADGRVILFAGLDPTTAFSASPLPADYDICDYDAIAATDIFDPVRDRIYPGSELVSQDGYVDVGLPDLAFCHLPSTDGTLARTLVLGTGQVLSIGGTDYWTEDGFGQPGNRIQLYTP